MVTSNRLSDARWDLAFWNLNPHARADLNQFLDQSEFTPLREAETPKDWSDRLFAESREAGFSELLDLGILRSAFPAASLQAQHVEGADKAGRMSQSQTYANVTGIPAPIFRACDEIGNKRPGPPIQALARNTGLNWTSNKSTLLTQLMLRVRRELKNGPISDLIIMPSLGVGGAERVGYWHYRLLTEKLGRNPLVILADHARIEDKYSDIRVLKLIEGEEGSFIAGRGPEILMQCISALVNMIQPETVHVVQSYPGFLWLEAMAAKTLPRTEARHIASFFCAHTHEDGVVDGYHLKVPYLEAVLDNYVSDNNYFIGELRKLHALPAQVCSVLDYPAPEIKPIPPETPLGTRPPRVLWAARFDHQKQPQIVPEIAQLMPDVEFHMYGGSVMGDGEFENEDLPPNVFLQGPFSNFFELPLAQSDVYLNTAFFEGVPQALAEASSVGLPIVASAVGGVPEIVDPRNGRLVQGVSDAQEYADAIRELLDPTENLRARKATIERMIETRSFEVFCERERIGSITF